MMAPLHLAGERLMLCPSGTVWWPGRRTLIVADLHLEKGSHFAARGRMVPPYDTRETLERLHQAIRRHSAARVLVLGDGLHDGAAFARMAEADRAQLGRVLGRVETIWIAGNHDPAPQAGLPGTFVPELVEDGLHFRHIGGTAALPRFQAELSGHFHPKATLPTRAGGVTRPCFLATAQRLLLPSFGAYTGGLDVLDPALGAVARGARRVFLLGEARLHSVPWEALRRPFAASCEQA
ncbi:MAG: ligase-associated DNA damage response endonuclease PdeM [Acetobacteraceae bacterium]|nr:ligase-associated DNA damage response endonuclease PdeM [Acetobacteraceae bacterium]